jgi:hypothetical protein
VSLRPTRLYRNIVGAVAIGVLFLAAGSGAYASSPAVGPKPGSHWQVFSGNTAVDTTSLAVDGPGRVLYAFSQDQNRTGPAAIQAWSLDRGTKLTPKVALPAAVVLNSSLPVAIDSADHAVFVGVAGALGSAPAVVVAKREGGVIAVRTVTSRFSASYSIVSMTVDARHRMLYLIGEPSACVGSSLCPGTVVGAGLDAVKVDAWSLGALSGGTVSSPYSAVLAVPAGCGQIITTNFPAGAVVSPNGHHLYFGCTSNRGALTLLGPNPGDVAGVADLDLTVAAANGPNSMQIRPVPGNFGNGDSIAVPSAARLILVAPAAAATNLKVYDTAHGYYVGSVGVDNIQLFGIGVDAANGEGYYIDRRGITSVDFAALPVPQGTLDSSFTSVEGPGTTRSVAVDPVTHRVLTVGSEDLSGGTSPFVVVYRGADSPGSQDPFSANEFASIDAPEIAGVTDSERVVTMGAIGAEERLVGGSVDFIQNATHEDTRGIVTRPGTRDVEMGVLNGIQLTNDEAVAQAVTEVQDDATTNDATAQSPSQVPSQYQSAAGDGPPIPAQCIDFGSSPRKDSAESESVSCDHTGQHVTANATGEPGRILLSAPCVQRPGDTSCAPVNVGQTVPDPVTVKSASAKADVARDGTGPMTTTLKSEADGVDIMGIVQIGHVTATATITAHGRSGSATVNYTREVTGLIINGTTVCASDCPLATVTAAVNAALGGRGRIELPNATIVQAKNGRLALLQDNIYSHTEHVLLDDLSDDNVLSPAMSITLYLDGSTTSREIVTLAALGGQEIYRIFRLGSFVPGVGPGTQSNLVSVGGRLSGTGAVVANTPFVAPPASPQPQTTSNGGIGAILSRAMHLGLRSPGDIAGVAILWMLLAVPAYLAARRRLLLDLPRLTPKGNS